MHIEKQLQLTEKNGTFMKMDFINRIREMYSILVFMIDLSALRRLLIQDFRNLDLNVFFHCFTDFSYRLVDISYVNR